jgi:hypothetical protein
VTGVSADDGKTWRQGNIIDLGGRGDHDGAIEATVAELSNGRLLMLIRTNLDRFWEAYCDDQGRYWREIRPSRIDASSSPGHLLRLASGRLALVWNRLCAEGKGVVRRAAVGLAETPASWQREELSLAFSADDAQTWSKPVVIARAPGGSLAYPHIFERRPGELWIATHQTAICLSLKEADFVQIDVRGLDGRDRADVGIHWTRFIVGWDLHEPERGRYDLEASRQLIRRARNLGLEVILSLHQIARWASRAPAPT